jgi:NAD(P)H-dependent FMN reductase
VKIAVFVGSLQKKSYNKALAHALEKASPEGVEFDYVPIDTVPYFSQDLEADVPAEVKKIRSQVAQADGVLFVTPEYNRGVPGVMKNALDWVSRPYGESAFKKKPLGIVGASATPSGSVVAQSQLRSFAGFLEMKLMGQPEIYVGNAYEVFDEAGNLLSERWEKNFRDYMQVFAIWVEEEK